MTPAQFIQSRQLCRSMLLLMRESAADMTRARLCGPTLHRQYQALTAAGIHPFEMVNHRSAEWCWTVGMIPRQIDAYDGCNWKRALKERRLARVLGYKVYQPGPRPGQLP